MRRHLLEMRDGDIDLAAFELLDRFVAGGGGQAQSRIGGLFGKGAGESADKGNFGVFGHAGGEDPGAFRRVEAGAEVQRRLDMLDRRRDQGRDLAGPGGRLHAGRGAHE